MIAALALPHRLAVSCQRMGQAERADASMDARRDETPEGRLVSRQPARQGAPDHYHFLEHP